jgi:hypothetical protein
VKQKENSTENHKGHTENHRVKFYIADPAGEKYVLKESELLKCWASTA